MRRLSRDSALLFLHIPKTAGTSLLAALDTMFEPGERVHLYDQQPDAIHPLEFADLPLEQKRRLRFVAGHFQYGLHKELPRPARYITVLRDPVDRLLSLYDHNRSYQQSVYHRLIADNDMTFEEFVLAPGIEQTDNDMVRFLSAGRASKGRCNVDMLYIAQRHLVDHFDVVMIQESMASGLAELEDLLGQDLPAIQRINVSPLRSDRSEVSQATLDAIEPHIRLDAKLYDWARSEFRELVANG